MEDLRNAVKYIGVAVKKLANSAIKKLRIKENVNVVDNLEGDQNDSSRQSCSTPVVTNGIEIQKSPKSIKLERNSSNVSRLSTSSVCRSSSRGNVNENDSEKGSTDVSSKLNDVNSLKRPIENYNTELDSDQPKVKVMRIENATKRKRKCEEMNDVPISRKILKFFSNTLGKRKFKEEIIEDTIENKKNKIEPLKYDPDFAYDKIKRLDNTCYINEFLFNRYLEDCVHFGSNETYYNEEEIESYTDEELQEMYDEIDECYPDCSECDLDLN